MKRLFVVGMILMALWAMTASIVFGVDVMRIKSGLNYINTDLVQDGYPVFKSSYKGGSVVMIDNFGNLIHYWTENTSPMNIGAFTWPQIMQDGHIIVSATDPNSSMSHAVAPPTTKGVGGDFDSLFEIDWDSNLVWAGGPGAFYGQHYASHHDHKKIWNKDIGDYTYLAVTSNGYSHDDAVALGADPQYDVATGYANGWSLCGVVEVNQDGETVWSWTFGDHLVQNYDATKTADFVNGYNYAARGATYGVPSDFPEKIDFNMVTDEGRGPCKDWTHINSLDYNPALGHICLNARSMSEMYIIDHDGTFVSTDNWEANRLAAQSNAGDFLYRFGNPHNYGRHTKETGFRNPGNHQFWVAHNIQWIGAGQSSAYDGFEVFGDIPGQGNLLIFDNGDYNPTGTASAIVEWNPYFNADAVDTGNYVDPPSAGYQDDGYSNQVVWSFKAGSTGFYSSYISGMQRMPNGNTIICAGAQSHFFEVAPNKALVWEYYKPEATAAASGDYVASISGAGAFAGPATFRCQKIPAGHPALTDRDLTPKGNFRKLVIEGATSPSAVTELQKFLGAL